MMGSISMVNSFSHVFTTVLVSANRTLAGLITGTVVGLIGLLIIWTGEWMVGKARMIDIGKR
jgi:ABC-type nitrate/sulfonate/bicarbonate transport system permease component